MHDPLYARILLLRQGREEVAIVGLDLLGFYRNDVQDLRRRAGFDAPGRFLFVAATHTHSGPDTLGLWGPFYGISGENPAYQTRIKESIAAALDRLEGALRPVTAEGARGSLDPRGLCRDSRDPQVIDPDLAVLRLKGKDGKAVATVVNWSCHAEVLGPKNRLLTADYPAALCARVEEKTGGACVFLNGMIGGLLTPDVTADDYAEAERVGRTVADAALALKTSARPSRPLAARAGPVLVPVENARYRLVLPALTFGHRLYAADGTPLPRWKKWTLAARQLLVGLTPATEPWVRSEVAVVDAGPARLLGMPGELFPELAVGGYGGADAFGRPVVDPRDQNPPDLSRAPKGPYLRDLVRAPAPMLVGLAGDELGYVVPGYDFKVRPGKLMLPRLPGHYEETNSIGPSATRILLDAAARLLKETP